MDNLVEKKGVFFHFFTISAFFRVFISKYGMQEGYNF